ncbi:hypothetical protein PFICI_08504 [Pestalotiopsis fici W106-1]|uniref:Heterokaryon incompatibility domain-containing protein n=1 Tax=Pestalotiopsis fici (strain W106-1 / CGMCC3.15140) TaxID=1229662 RepID=W3X0I8_PESFW|nr:uncharacterized protein PFICI_08504 [Pestalotiopsis fici W106-1]ETS78651.1 hypothetical protein PFICI_08504 [Pestalotiopsis fici W106-1]
MDYKWSYGPRDDEDDNCATCGQDHKSICLINLPDSQKSLGLDPNWIDLGRLKAWAQHCDSAHGGTCHSLTEWADISPQSLAPLLLVDVDTHHLVEMDLSISCKIKYAALSYVWGRLPDVLETTKANLADLKTPGAVNSARYAISLPDTVRDAVALTKCLGLRYLWVDRLCIVQDDMVSKPLQLAQMGAIYANSYVTLVASDGQDANYGFRGSVRGVSQPRHFEPPVLTYKQGRRSLIIEPVFELDYDSTEWQRRGWTFQERTLSRRNLVFQEGRVFWECPGAVWTEEMAHNSEDGSGDQRWQRRKPSSYQLTMSSWPDLLQYELLVRAYNTRILSFPSDGLNAFLGISTALSRSFRGGLLYGVPEYYFDIALLWIPFSPIHRRLVNGEPQSMLPSWSWVGWEGGNINLSILPQLTRHVGATFGSFPLEYVEIHPMVTWLKTNSDSGTQDKIDNGYHEAVLMKNDSTLTLPDGWSRTNVTKGRDLGTGFIHKSLPDTVFTWPLHIPEHPIEFSQIQWEPLLKFETTRAFLHIGSRIHRDWEGRNWNEATNAAVETASLYHIRGPSGDWAGMLYSNDFDRAPAADHERCEFVLVSRGITSKDHVGDHNGLEEWAQVPEIMDLSTYEFYNVLWIHRIDGIAYRRGLGRIWKDAWHLQLTEQTHVTLG